MNNNQKPNCSVRILTLEEHEKKKEKEDRMDNIILTSIGCIAIGSTLAMLISSCD